MLCKLHYFNFKGTEEWAKFLKSNFCSKNGDSIRYYRPSTFWTGIQTGATISKLHILWLIGDGKKIDLWRDT
ncbi:hypothetical protein GIB67_010854 [Kingdonia uniflora]|uniref:Uncharacterized protein n=1 Tax=Kingdonia uniflora TaxID=39325 RepID=A0A7J7PAF9_9MAGN|nr:hypothetical protein GIB67_010854 [Kingdonia uniflora]